MSALTHRYIVLHTKGRKMALTRQGEQDQPVHNQDRPEDGQVEDLKPAAYETRRDGLGGRVPELELGKPADKRLELILLFCREPAGVAVFHAFIGFERGIEFGREESEEQVQEVDTERVCN